MQAGQRTSLRSRLGDREPAKLTRCLRAHYCIRGRAKRLLEPQRQLADSPARPISSVLMAIRSTPTRSAVSEMLSRTALRYPHARMMRTHGQSLIAIGDNLPNCGRGRRAAHQPSKGHPAATSIGLRACPDTQSGQDNADAVTMHRSPLKIFDCGKSDSGCGSKPSNVAGHRSPTLPNLLEITG